MQRQTNDLETYNFKAPPELMAQFDKLAKDLYANRSVLLRQLIALRLEQEKGAQQEA